MPYSGHHVNLSMRGIALNMRPLLYGICIWIALGGDEEKKRDPGRKKETEEEWTAQESPFSIPAIYNIIPPANTSRICPMSSSSPIRKPRNSDTRIR